MVGQTFNDAQRKAILSSFTHESNGEYDKALAALGSAGIEPGNYFLNLRSGWLRYLKQDYPNAVIAYNAALTTQPQSVEVLVGLLNCYYAVKNDVQLQTTADQLLAFDPANYSAQRYLILSDIGRKEYSKAEIRLEKALRLYPIDLQLNINLTETYFKQSRVSDARNILSMLEAIYGSQNTQLSALRKTLE
jgi:tetratricopeptide (TPR) repeat protein